MAEWLPVAIQGGVGLVTLLAGAAIGRQAGASAATAAIAPRETALPPAPPTAPTSHACAVHTEQIAADRIRIASLEERVRDLELGIAADIAEIKTMMRQKRGNRERDSE